MSVRIRMVAGLSIAAATVLAGGGAAMASATGGTPGPHGSPPPVIRHHEPHLFCFASLLTETDTLGGRQIALGQGQQGGNGSPHGTPAPSPSPTGPIVQGVEGTPPPVVTAPRPLREIEVVQLVKVCETISGWGRVTAVTATDESAPFAWIFTVGQGGGLGGLPAGLPGQVKGALIS